MSEPNIKDTMRIGIYFENQPHPIFYDNKIFNSNHKIIGYSSGAQFTNLQLKYIPDPDELLSGSEILLICAEHSSCMNIMTRAIRKGVHVFHCNLSVLTLENLLDLRVLLQEINVRIGFSSSGFLPFIQPKINFPTDLALFYDCKRDVTEPSFEREFKMILTFDLGTFIRTTDSNIRRVRVGSFPVMSKDFKLLSLRLELENGSVMCYTLSNNNTSPSHTLSCYVNNDLHLPTRTSEEPLTHFLKQSVEENLQNFLKDKDFYQPPMSIDMAIDLYRLLDKVFEKLQL